MNVRFIFDHLFFNANSLHLSLCRYSLHRNIDYFASRPSFKTPRAPMSSNLEGNLRTNAFKMRTKLTRRGFPGFAGFTFVPRSLDSSPTLNKRSRSSDLNGFKYELLSLELLFFTTSVLRRHRGDLNLIYALRFSILMCHLFIRDYLHVISSMSEPVCLKLCIKDPIKA